MGMKYEHFCAFILFYLFVSLFPNLALSSGKYVLNTILFFYLLPLHPCLIFKNLAASQILTKYSQTRNR